MRTSLALLVVALCGCSSTNVSSLVKALAKDPATVSVRIRSIYGSVDFVRVGGATNSVSISPDGTITTGPK